MKNVSKNDLVLQQFSNLSLQDLTVARIELGQALLVYNNRALNLNVPSDLQSFYLGYSNSLCNVIKFLDYVLAGGSDEICFEE